MPAVDIERIRTDGRAECDQCKDLNPDSTRERARMHAFLRDHTTRFVIEDTTVYRRATS